MDILPPRPVAATLSQINLSLYELRKEKVTLTNEVAELQFKLSCGGLTSKEREDINLHKAEVFADASEIDQDIAELNAKIKFLAHPVQERDAKLDNIRAIVISLLGRGADLDSSIKFAVVVEEKLQALIPHPEVPALDLL